MRSVTAVRDGNVFIIRKPSPSLRKLLHNLLSYTRRAYAKKGRGQMGMESTQITCYEIAIAPNGDEQFIGLSGYLYRLTTELAKFGYDLRVKTRPWPKDMTVYEPNWDRVANVEWRWRQLKTLKAILANERGRICWPTGAGKSFLIAQICKLLPKARIDITTGSVDVITDLYRNISAACTRVSLIGGGSKMRPSRINCVSGKSLHHMDGNADILIIDECVTGDAAIATPTGDVRLDAVVVGSEVLCHDGKNVVTRRVTKTWRRGRKSVLRLTTSAGEIRCTSNHPVRTTQGWKQAGSLKAGDQLLYLANADAENCLARTLTDVSAVGSSAITENHTPEPTKVGARSGKKSKRHFRFANAAAESKLNCREAGRSSSSSEIMEAATISGIFSGTEQDRPSTDSCYRSTSDKRYSGRCSETAASDIRPKAVPVRECRAITDSCKKNGRGTKLKSCQGFDTTSVSRKMEATEKRQSQRTVDAYPRCERSTILSIQNTTESNESQPNGSIKSVPLESRGGSATTVASATVDRCDCTQKILTKNLSKSRSGGYAAGTDGQRQQTVEPADTRSISTLPAAMHSEKSECINTYLPAWRTNVVSLISIEPLEQPEAVYDIEVEGCHNFFANGLLVHNCQEFATDDYQERIGRYRYAKVIGFSANRQGDRSDGADFELRGMCGEELSHITYAQAVEHEMVVPIEVRWYTCHMRYNPCAGAANAVAKKRLGFWKNKTRNKLIANVVNEFSDDDQVLIVVDTIEHAMQLKKELPNFTLCYGNTLTDTQRKRYEKTDCIGPKEPRMHFERRMMIKRRFERGTLKKVIATGVWNRGVDFRNLAVLVRADGKNSRVADTQIPGRVSRTRKDGKVKTGIVIDFVDIFDDGFAARSADRRRCYARHEWVQKNMGMKDGVSIERNIIPSRSRVREL